ncbi:PadR family transcriptional regulator [Actinomadura graeca]|uniref:PadR family transcriptional regulator n=1 Tax=Actinomadura graeca TaxID=2750812 RepID=A0ABX8QP97_9ACTN|nr:PadR family transcriptional regulator [Actinomadura graeca]QXJ20433.1 PadR family transcriptional regulator [Actinomadura graeca]
MQDVVLALLAKKPSHGYELRARLRDTLGPVGEGLNGGQVYVTLRRLEKAGLAHARVVGQIDRPDRKVYELTLAGRDRVTAWLGELDWDRAAPTGFHLKLAAAATSGLGDPVAIVGAQRHELLRLLAAAQRAALAEPDGSGAALLLQGSILRLQADLRWLDACETHWTTTQP